MSIRNWNDLETRIGSAIKLTRPPVAVTFLEEASHNVEKFSGTEPSRCSFWRLAAGGRVFYTAPENHFNCAVGAYTHNIPLSPEREKETEQTLKRMFDLGYVKPDEVPQIPKLAKTPGAILYAPLGETPVAPDVVFVCLQTGGGDAFERGDFAGGSGEGSSGAGSSHMHGAAGNDAARFDSESWMHRQPGLHRLDRR